MIDPITAFCLKAFAIVVIGGVFVAGALLALALFCALVATVVAIIEAMIGDNKVADVPANTHFRAETLVVGNYRTHLRTVYYRAGDLSVEKVKALAEQQGGCDFASDAAVPFRCSFYMDDANWTVFQKRWSQLTGVCQQCYEPHPHVCTPNTPPSPVTPTKSKRRKGASKKKPPRSKGGA